MRIGYARVSTYDQNPELQLDALKKSSCKKIFTDKISGVSQARPQLDRLIDNLREGDTVVVWRLDRLGRSIKDLIEWMDYFQENKIGFVSLQESINTTTPTGKLIFHIMAALAEFERNLIRERTMAGLRAAKARGRKGGRPPKLDQKRVKTAIKLHKQGDMSVQEICDMMEISRKTLYNYINKN